MTTLERSFLTELSSRLRPGGIRVFQQLEDDPALFSELNSAEERLYTPAEISAVARFEQVIKIIYG